VTKALRAHGHDVYPLLTGMGERAHLSGPEVDVELHVTDVLNLLRYEDLNDVVLVGHSYAGSAVITCVADRMPERISKLVFVDTGPLPDGVSMSQFGAPEEHEENAARVESGWRLPPPPWAELASNVTDLDPNVVPMLTERAVPQPWATVTSPVSLTGAWEKLPRLGILCEFTEAQAREFAGMAPLFRHMAGDQWRYVELPTWHWPMFNKAEELTEILLQG
jgi:pimeloyl-ACP methyl ester carboxylesterase